MDGIKPGDAAAPAKSGDRRASGVAASRRGEGERLIERRHRFGVGDLGDDGANRLYVRRFLRVAIANEEIGRDGEKPELCEAPHDVADMFVQAEDFLRDENDRAIGAALGTGEVGRRAVRQLGHARLETVDVRHDGARRGRARRMRKPGRAGRKRGHDTPLRN